MYCAKQAEGTGPSAGRLSVSTVFGGGLFVAAAIHPSSICEAPVVAHRPRRERVTRRGLTSCPSWSNRDKAARVEFLARLVLAKNQTGKSPERGPQLHGQIARGHKKSPVHQAREVFDVTKQLVVVVRWCPGGSIRNCRIVAGAGGG
jgi:hypothetical protein